MRLTYTHTSYRTFTYVLNRIMKKKWKIHHLSHHVLDMSKTPKLNWRFTWKWFNCILFFCIIFIIFSGFLFWIKFIKQKQHRNILQLQMNSLKIVNIIVYETYCYMSKSMENNQNIIIVFKRQKMRKNCGKTCDVIEWMDETISFWRWDKQRL